MHIQDEQLAKDHAGAKAVPMHADTQFSPFTHSPIKAFGPGGRQPWSCLVETPWPTRPEAAAAATRVVRIATRMAGQLVLSGTATVAD